MAGIMDLLLKGLGAEDSVKDYQHAARIFVDSNMLRSPKYAFMFYVVFDYNDSVDGLATPMSKGVQIGALCKSAQLPKYTIEHQVSNAYNRTSISQKRLRYDPVVLKFHDDSDDIIREFWYDYMSFYYRDSDYTTPIYAQPHKYNDRLKDGWGYGLRTQQGNYGFQVNNTNEYRPLKAIRIYSFYRKRFSEYMLVNPVITSFRHGEHTNEGSNLMEHEMTVAYESVKYSVGYVSPDNFGDSMLLLYDMTPSKLSSGGTKSIFGTGGLIQTIDNTITDLASGNYAAAFLKINRAQQTFKGSSISQVLRDEGLDIVNRAVRTGYNPLSTVNAPTIGSSTGVGLGLLALAAGGLTSTSNSRSGQQNNLGPQITLAKPTPTTLDQASPAADYRAVSGGQVVAQSYKPVQQKPQFPQLPTDTTTATTGARTPSTTKPVTPGEVASQNINLNKASTVVSASKQGTPAIQTPPTPANLNPLSDEVIGLTFIATTLEYSNAISDPTTTASRLDHLKTQMTQVYNSDAVNAILATDPTLLEVRNVFIAFLSNPQAGINHYGTNLKFETELARMSLALVALETPDNQKLIVELGLILAEVAAAEAAGDLDKAREISRRLLAFLRNPKVVAAFSKITDVKALANDLNSAIDSNDLTKFDTSGKRYEINE